MVAVSGEWPAIPELSAIGFQVLGDFATGLARFVQPEPFAGAAPAGADAQALAVSVLWTAGAILPVANSGSHPTMSDASTLVEPLVQLLVARI